EEDVSIGRVFFGGVNVFLQQRIPLFRYLPRFLDRFLDARWILRWATSRGLEIEPRELGELTVSMLRGSAGYQRKEVKRLCHWLQHSVHPNLINLSNMLIAGSVPAMKSRLQVPVLVTLQGDDIFLDQLIEPYRSQALKEIRRLVKEVDGFLVFSNYYAEYLGDLFEIPASKLELVPLGLDTADYESFVMDPDAASLSEPGIEAAGPATIGYLARLAPEKGLHVLVDAFLQLRERPGMEQVQLKIAGWLGEQQQDYVDEQLKKIATAGAADVVDHVGSVDRAGKLDFLQQIDVLSVPTVYREPKGLFVLEALAAGVPVVQPCHGAFPELLERIPGGLLVNPEDPADLAEKLYELLRDVEKCRRLGQRGLQVVHQQYNADKMATATWDVYRKYLSSETG
ncbi:MAG TPA: glycosyltransferase family 1 protein, partial [Planctomycetaceae bacterium]|nr:glycosyltransferase family 1 protein [Planctomycetaceae bacterium]